MSNGLILYSGEMGGKSTFISGLYSHLISRDDIDVSYRTRVSRSFENEVTSALFTRREFPHQTTEPYIIDLKLERESQFQPSTEIRVLDVPGQIVGSSRHERPWEQRQQRDVIKQQYDELDVSETSRGKVLSPDDWNTVLTHEYHQSDNLIFLLNLYKLLMTDLADPSYDADDVRQAAKEKNVAVVATGTDVLNHKPDEDVVSSKGILDYIRRSGSPVDAELLDEVTDVPTASQVTRILQTVTMADDISFFGVAVPSREPGEDERPTITEGGDIETWGFENVVEWMD